MYCRLQLVYRQCMLSPYGKPFVDVIKLYKQILVSVNFQVFRSSCLWLYFVKDCLHYNLNKIGMNFIKGQWSLWSHMYLWMYVHFAWNLLEIYQASKEPILNTILKVEGQTTVGHHLQSIITIVKSYSKADMAILSNNCNLLNDNFTQDLCPLLIIYVKRSRFLRLDIIPM